MNDRDLDRPSGPQELLAALSRRRVTAIATVSLCIVAAVLFALLLPARYRSGSTILIEQQEVPVDLVRSTVTSYADQRLQVINQRVMTSSNLLDIIRRNALYPERQGRDTREELVQRMRNDIAMKLINADVIDPRSGVPRQATIAFSVSYTSRVPEHAVKVANELASLYLSENLTERQRLASNTTSFLDEESIRLGKELAATEARLADFKDEHADAMPELQSLNRTLLDRAEQELRSAEMRHMSLDQQRVFVEARLTEVKPNSMLTTDGGERVLTPHDRLRVLRSQLASARAVYAPEHPDIARLEREIRGLEAQTGEQSVASSNELMRNLEDARGELAQARDRYAVDHPDVQRLERRITALQADLDKLSSQPAAPKPSPTETPDNPAYIQLQTQLSATLNEQKALEESMRKLRAQIAGYERQVVGSPQIEREYRELVRDYESASLKYRDLRAKQMEAQLAQNLETERKGERFTVIEPPMPPEEPVSPNRPLILALGAVLALVITFGVIAILEKVDTSVRSRADLTNLLATAPLAVLPWIETSEDRLLRRRRQRYALAGAAASVLLSAGLIHLFYRPLDLVWLAVMRRLGGL
jgi:polysaccharide biosynthesis transport protein